MRPLTIVAAGMQTSVGVDGPSSAAAIRCVISGAVETRFMDRGGEWILGCPAPVDAPLQGRERLAKLVLPPVSECLQRITDAKLPDIPLMLCLAEPGRAGRFAGLEEGLLRELPVLLKAKLHPKSAIFAEGRLGIVSAIRAAERLLYEKVAPYCLIAGVDTFLVRSTLAEMEARDRLLTSVNSNGFIPGEAGAAVVLARPKKDPASQLQVRGIGTGLEKATVDSEEPLRADGLLEALRGALADARATFDDVDFRIVDSSGEQYRFKETALAIGRAVRKVKPRFPLWHPADCIGEVGAAIGPCILAVAFAASKKGYAPGPGILCHLGDDDGRRAALVLRYEEGGA